MDISTKHIEDLDNFDSLSDACAKALILNLLDLIAADAEPDVKKVGSTVGGARFETDLRLAGYKGFNKEYQ